MDIRHTKREVIEKKILVALNDDDKVALIVTKNELDVLIMALEFSEGNRLASMNKWREMRNDFETLRNAAFPSSRSQRVTEVYSNE